MTFKPMLATFSFVLFVVGMVLTYLTIDQQSKLSNQCVSTKVQTGFNIILMLSVMMMVIPLIQLGCHWGCGCPQNNLWYRWIIIIICVLFISTGGVVWNGLDNDANCSLSSVKYYIKGLVILASVLLTTLVIVPQIPAVKGMMGDQKSNKSSVEMQTMVGDDSSKPLLGDFDQL